MSIPYIKRERLPNGLQYFNHEENYLPLTKIRIAFHGGGTALPPEKAGTMALLYDYLVSSQDALLVEFDEIGTSPVFYVGENGSAIDVTVNSMDTEKAFELLSRMLREPQFDLNIFERVKLKHIAGLSESQRTPNESVKTALTRSIYGVEHPLGTLGADISISLQSTKLEDLYHAYREFIGPQDIAVITAGRIDESQAHTLSNKFFGDWRSSAVAAPAVPKLLAIGHANTLFVARTNLRKTYVELGGHGPALGDNDEYAFRMAARVISDKVGRQLRRNNSSCTERIEIHMFQETGYYSVACSVDREQTWKAAEGIASAAFLSLMENFDGTSMPYLRRSQAWDIVTSFRSSYWTVEKISSIFWNDLADDYYIKSLEKINHVTQADVEHALHKYFRKDQIHIVVMGDPSLAPQSTRRPNSP
jgi:zinc protease